VKQDDKNAAEFYRRACGLGDLRACWMNAGLEYVNEHARAKYSQPIPDKVVTQHSLPFKSFFFFFLSIKPILRNKEKYVKEQKKKEAHNVKN